MMMSKHYIYEIFGIKIGATNDIERRMKQQGAKEGEYRIIEEHTNAKTCSIREIELQKEFNYPVDRVQYWKTLKMQKKTTSKEARKKAVANTDFKALSIKRVANTDFKEASKKRVANTDYKQVFESRKGKVNYPAIMAKIDWESRNNKFKKPVNQYDLEGNFIKRWDGAKDAAKSLNKKAGFDITNCCKGKNKTAYKYIWKYAG